MPHFTTPYYRRGLVPSLLAVLENSFVKSGLTLCFKTIILCPVPSKRLSGEVLVGWSLHYITLHLLNRHHGNFTVDMPLGFFFLLLRSGNYHATCDS
jgi:hypothetical protein